MRAISKAVTGAVVRVCNSINVAAEAVEHSAGAVNYVARVAYEAKHYPMELPDPVEAITFEMEHRGLTVKDLEPMIGKSNRVYEILNHKRSLTLKMIWKLHEELGIPAESLIKPPHAKAS